MGYTMRLYTLRSVTPSCLAMSLTDAVALFFKSPLKVSRLLRDVRSLAFFFHFFIQNNIKLETFTPLKSRLGACCLTLLIYTFKMFKGAVRPRHTYIRRFKGIGLYR